MGMIGLGRPECIGYEYGCLAVALALHTSLWKPASH